MDILRILGEPTRLRLILLLDSAELTVAELQEVLGMGQSRISSHLGQLKSLGLVKDRRVGRNIFYTGPGRLPEGVRAILDEAAIQLPDAATDAAALELALRKRRDKASEYFNRLAGKFGRTYIPGRSWSALSHALLRLLPPMVIADLGAGEGTLSQLLARTAKQVIAVDNSEKMVRFATNLAAKNGVENLEFRLGEIESPPVESGSVDLALFSQALHHASNPETAVREAYRILRTGGKVVILDLASHSYEQARELYAHVWLGFSEMDLHEMLRKAGFVRIEAGVVSAEKIPPNFRTILAVGEKP